VTIIGVNFGIKAYDQRAFLDSLPCTNVFAISDRQLACTVNPANEIDIRKEFTVTAEVLGKHGSQHRAFTYTESWTHIEPQSSYTLQAGLITVYGKGFTLEGMGG